MKPSRAIAAQAQAQQQQAASVTTINERIDRLEAKLDAILTLLQERATATPATPPRSTK